MFEIGSVVTFDLKQCEVFEWIFLAVRFKTVHK